MNLHSHTKKRGKKTARAVLAPLALSLAFVAMTGLAPQQADAAPTIITADLPGPYAGSTNATVSADGDDGIFRINADGSASAWDATTNAWVPLTLATPIDFLTAAGGFTAAGGSAVVGFDGGNTTAVLPDNLAFAPLSQVLALGAPGAQGAGAAEGGDGGDGIIEIAGTATFGMLSVNGGVGGTGAPLLGTGSGGDGGAGMFTDRGNGNSLSIVHNLFAVTSGNGGANDTNSSGGRGGDALVDLAGTLRFVTPANATPPILPQMFSINRGNPGTTALAGDVQIEIGTLEVGAGDTVNMTVGLNYTNYAAANATDMGVNNFVDFGTLKFNGGSVFSTANAVGWYDPLTNRYTAGTHYTVQNLYVRGGGTNQADGMNTWNTDGTYTPAATNGILTFDVTGVAAGDTMLLTQAPNPSTPPPDFVPDEIVDFSGFGREQAHTAYGNPNFRITADTKADHRALMGHEFTLINGATGWDDASQWGPLALRHLDTMRTAGVVYYDQNGTSRFYYDTYGVEGGTASDRLNAFGVGELSAGKAYSQYQAAVAETAADVFLNNTWVANRDVADIAQPDTFALTGRVSYFTINQDQDHSSEADKDQLAAAISGGYKFENGAGETTLGAFFEYGHGEYDTDTTVRGWGTWGQGFLGQGVHGHGSDKITGDGDADLFGGGLFVYHDFMEGTYLDGGFRFGTVDQTFRIKGHGLNGNLTKIDTDTSYWGLNLGVGHKFQITNCANLDLYGKFLWTRLDGNDFTNGYGERIQMDDVDSIRTRVGARVTQGLGEGNLSVYYGAAWEQEWDGEATGKVAGRRIVEAADNSGASAFGELGLSYKPQGQNFAVEVGAFGLAGSQQGGGGTIGLKFDF